MKPDFKSERRTIRGPAAFLRFSLALLTAVMASGCACFNFSPSRHHASSVVEFLYPNQTDHVDTPTVPVLSLPLKVGVTFVPEETRPNHARPDSLSETRKTELLQQVSSHFLKYPFVKSIEIIPSAYLRPGGGFRNIDQLRAMFGVDVIALVGYDQVQFTDEGLLSLTYWTVVGAWVVRGEKNDTQTMMDTVVYDVASRKLLFRAPGLSSVRGSATPVNQSEQLRRDRLEGFQSAATNMVSNLDQQLELFRERVKSAPEEFKVVHKPGYTGSGSAGWFELLLLGGMGGYLWRTSRTRRS